MSVETQERRRQDPAEAENTDDTMHVSRDDAAGVHSEELTTEQVRQGHTGDHVRYILMASVAGAILVMAIVIAYFAI